MPKISVIVPIYNAEKYLSRCLDSILTQNFTDFELILIDDGSTDNSGEICDNHAKRDNRIKVLHKKNEGVSVARNVGLANAQGEWILFVDADDWVELNWLEVINKEVNLINADLYVFGHRKCSYEHMYYEFCPPYMIENNHHFVITQYYRHSCWNYTFKYSIIKKWNIRFPPELKVSEDQAFLLKYISIIDKIVFIDKILYNYYDNSDSVVNQQIDISYAMCNILAANDFLKFCNQNNINKALYDYNVYSLYKDFCIYYLKIKRENKINTNKDKNVYKRLYQETLHLYPEFKKHCFFALLSFHWILSLPIFRIIISCKIYLFKIGKWIKIYLIK